MSGARFLKGPKTPILTALPTGLAASDDGLEINLLADAGNGVVWRLRYRHYEADGVTLNASPYKWEAVAATDLYAEIDTAQTLATATSVWGDPATAGPDIIVPLAGDYDISFGANFALSANAGVMQMGVATAAGATPAGRLLTVTQSVSGVASTEQLPGSSSDRYPGLAAGTLLRCRYLWTTINSPAHQWSHRWLRVRPVRLS